MATQTVTPLSAQVSSVATFTATGPEPFTDIRLHWLSPLLKIPGKAGIGEDLPRYTPDRQAGGFKPWPGVKSRISVE